MEMGELEQPTEVARDRMEQQVLRQYSVLGTINRLYREALTGATDEMVARTCLTLAEELTGSKLGFLCQLSQAGRFAITAISGKGLGDCNLSRTDSAMIRSDREMPGILGRVLLDGQSTIIDQPTSHPDWVGIPEGHPPIACFMGVPLKRANRTIGMIGLANKESGFSLGDQRDIETLSDHFVDALSRRREQDELRQVNRALRTLNECNQAMMHIADETALLHEVCRIIVEVGGYGIAWIGFAELDEKKTVRRVVQAGLGEEDLQGLGTTWADSEQGRGPTGIAIRTGNPFICNRMSAPADFIPCPEQAARRGCTSSIALPLITNIQTLGAIHIYAEDPDAFGTEEANLLVKLANGLAYNIMTLCTQSERRHAEEALRQSEARYRAVVEQSADGIYLVEVETKRVLEANPAFAQMLGYTPDEIVGLSVYDFVAAEEEDIDRRFEGLVRGQGPLTFERRFRRKDGSLVEIWLSVNVIFYGGKRVVCSLVRDLTEKKALEAQFLRAQRMESLGLLAGGIAHDLNNILTPVLINVELLQRILPEGPAQKMLSSVSSAALRGAGMVKQVLAFSRGMEGERLSVSPRHLLKEMVAFARETFPKSIQIEAELPDGLWSLHGNPTQLHQVLLNLCVNAKDAMPQGGTLTLFAENVSLDEAYAGIHPEARPGAYVLLGAKDTGGGIPASILEKIFDPFFTTKERGKGTGLGLSTVHGIVKDHGGFVSVKSEVGAGTTFHIYLPASSGPERVSEKEKPPSLSVGGGELILVAEDEASVREITQMTLEIYGYQVISAPNGKEVVALYAQHRDRIQAVLIDMVMPIMNGPETIRALQALNPEVRVIVTSGTDSEQVTGAEDGPKARAFLPKPFTAEGLLKTLAEVLRTPSP